MSQITDRKTYIFEQATIPRAVMSLCVPTVIANLVMLVYGLADSYFVGMLNDPVQTAAVTLASPVTLAFYAVSNLFGVGGSSMMSRALGRGDMKAVRQSSSFSFYGALVCSLLYSALCALFMKPLLSMLGATEATAGATAGYLLWTVCLGAAPSILNIAMANMIRSEGAALHASVGTMSGCVLNIVLDPIFILPFGLNMGAEGAALATMLSNCFALGYFFVYLFVKRRTTCVCISPRQFTLRWEIAGGVCKVGVPASIQNLLNVLSHLILNNLAAAYGTAALAGMGIASRIGTIPWNISDGISYGVMPLVGYNYAAKRIGRMKKALKFSMTLCAACMFAMAAGICLLSVPLTGAFIDDAETVAYGSKLLYGLSLSVPFMAIEFMAVATFQATGKGSLSLLMAVLRKLVFEIPAMYALNALLPLYGLSYARLASEICMLVIGLYLLRRLLRQIERSVPAQQ